MADVKAWLRGAYVAANHGLERLEEARHGDEPAGAPILFIIGAPRTGSTLLIQLLIQAFELSWLSNLHHRAFGYPGLIERLLGPWRPVPRSFESRYGTTRGLWGPSEAPRYWRRFFPAEPDYVTAAHVTPERVAALRGSLRAMARLGGRPVVIKNLYNSARLELLVDALPEAVFLHQTRDEVEVGHSLLEGRIKRAGDLNAWFSLEPSNIDALRPLEPHAQVIEQVRGINRDIERGLVGSLGRRFVVDYARLTQSPRIVVAELEAFMASRGAPLRRRAGVVIPERFERRSEVRIPAALYEAMAGYAQKRGDDDEV